MYVYLLIFLRAKRLPSRIYILLSSVFTFSFPFYIFLIITSYITFYLIFYLILSFSARLATTRTPHSLYFSYLPILMFHTYFLHLYIFIHSPFPLPFRLPFLSYSLHSHFHSCSPPLLSFACSSFSSDPFYFRYPFFAFSFLTQYFTYPFPHRSLLPPFCTASIQYMFPRFFLSRTYSIPRYSIHLVRSPVPTTPHIISHPIPRYSFAPFLFPSHLSVFR